jgi:kinesin family protein 2/24
VEADVSVRKVNYFVCVLQEGEISADLFTFHEAVSQLQLLEEEVLDSHTSLAQMMPQWMELARALLAMTTDVDYDQDGEICSSCNHHSSKKKKQLDGSENII